MVHYVPNEYTDSVESEGLKPAGVQGDEALRQYSRFLRGGKPTREALLKAIRARRNHPKGESMVYGFPGLVDVERDSRLKDWLRGKTPYEINVEALRSDGMLEHAEDLDALDIDYDKIPKIGPVLGNQKHPKIIVKGGVVPSKYLIKQATLYHGSHKKHPVLKPQNLHGDPDVASAVFATPNKDVALMMASPWTDADLNQGSIDGVDYMREMRPGAFRVFDRPGYIHTVPEDSFKELKGRNPDYEVISEENVKAVKIKKIANVLKALKARGIHMSEYDPESEGHKAAVKRMADRVRSMTADKKRRYMNWMRGENPELAEAIRMLKQSDERAYQVSGDAVQGVGLRKLYHKLLAERGVKGLAVNNPRKGTVELSMTADGDKASEILDVLKSALRQRTGKDIAVRPGNQARPRRVSLSPEDLDKLNRKHNLLFRRSSKAGGDLSLTPAADFRQEIKDRYLLEDDGENLSGYVPRGARAQLTGKEVPYGFMLRKNLVRSRGQADELLKKLK